MRILYFHQYFCTPKGSSGVRSYEFARRWVAAGHEVEIITGTSSHDIALKANTIQKIDGITVRTLGVRYTPKMGFLRRLFVFFHFALLSSLYAAKSGRFDVVLATSTPLTIAIPGLVSKWIARKPLIFEVRDVWPDAIVEIGGLKNPLIIAIARILEQVVYRSAEHIIPLSTGMMDRIANKGVPRSKMSMFPNCCDLDRFKSGRRDRYRKRKDGRFVILYAGAINTANNIELLIDVIDLLQSSDDWEWWFVGDGNKYELLKSEAKSRCWKNVILYGAKSRSEVVDYVAGADCGIVSFVPQPVYYENSPNKFFDYIAGGLPVVFGRSTWLQNYINEYECGYVCHSADAAMMYKKILQLKNKKIVERTRMGKNARKLAQEHFSRDMIASQYLDVLSRYV